MLERSDDRGVVSLAVRRPVPPGPEVARLAWALLDACEAIEADAVQPVAVVLSCPSAAFFILPPASAAEYDIVPVEWARATAAVARLSPPTIAVLDGDALGPAWELALACDLRVAGPDARVGSPEIRFGRMPAAGGTQRLARLVGRGAALRLLLFGEVITASDALARGLLHRVASTSSEEPLTELLAALRHAAPIALAYTKEAARSAGDLSLAAGLRLEADLAALLQTTADRAEGVTAALERRAATFHGQ